MNEINLQKTITDKVLKTLKIIDNEAFVAGGAPRNWKECRPANDIDVYMRWHGNCTVKTFIQNLQKLLEGSVERMDSIEECNYSFTGEGFSVKKIINFKYETVLFQIIVILDEEPTKNFQSRIINHIDTGINRIGWCTHRDTRFILTNDYLKDVENKTLTVFTEGSTDQQIGHCLRRHLPKMVNYYPDCEIKLGDTKKVKL